VVGTGGIAGAGVFVVLVSIVGGTSAAAVRLTVKYRVNNQF